MSRLIRCSVSALLVVGFLATAIGAKEQLRLRSNEVVAFLGGTNVVNLQNAGYLEASLCLSAETQPRFIDLAWEGDTVFRQGTVIERWRKDKFGDLAEQLNSNEVTTVFLMFGQNEALAATTVSDFAAALEQMLRACKQGDRQVVVVSPIPFERANDLLPDLSQRNNELAELVSAMSELADSHQCHFVDLFQHFADNEEPLTSNGLHIRASKQQVVSTAITTKLGIPQKAVSEPLRNAVAQKHRLWMNYWRPANWKCLYGDDGKRNFGKATGDSVTLREEWKQLPILISKSETEIWKLAKELKRQPVNTEAKP